MLHLKQQPSIKDQNISLNSEMIAFSVTIPSQGMSSSS